MSTYEEEMYVLVEARQNKNRKQVVNSSRNLERLKVNAFTLDDSSTMISADQVFNDLMVSVTRYDEDSIWIDTKDYHILVDLKTKTYKVDDYYE